MIFTKNKKFLVTFLQKQYIFKPSKGKHLINKIEKYIDIIKLHYPRHKRILKLLEQRLYDCLNYIPKKRPKNIKRGKRGKMPSISLAKMGKIWYHDKDTMKNKLFDKNDIIPDNYIKGMIKNTPNNNTPEARKKNSISTKKSRAKETETQKQERLRKYHETIAKRKN